MEKDGILKIAVVGAESTGKTWLCERLAAHYNTVWVPEYAREYFNDSDIYNYTLEDLVIIAKKQLELESRLTAKANRFLFCDTTFITLKIWAELEFKQTPEFITTQLKACKYDHYFITDNSLPWEADSQRQNKHSRDLLFEMNLQEVKKMNCGFSIVTGENEARLNSAVTIIDNFNLI